MNDSEDGTFTPTHRLNEITGIYSPALDGI